MHTLRISNTAMFTPNQAGWRSHAHTAGNQQNLII
jgi:hypothetical protein